MEISGMVGGKKHGDGDIDCSRPCLFLHGAGCRLTGGDAVCIAPKPEPHEQPKRAASSKWAQWEVDLAMSDAPAEAVAEATGRTVNAVKQKRLNLNGTHDMVGRPWTAHDDYMAMTMRVADAAIATGRTVNAVKHRRRRLGVRADAW